MFNLHCSQAPISQEHGCSDVSFSDYPVFPPPLLKSDNHFDGNSDENLLRSRYRRWCQDYSLPHQNSSFFPPNQASGLNHHSFQESSHGKNSTEFNGKSLEDNSFSNIDFNTPSTHPFHFSSSAQPDSDIWDVIFQGSERRNGLSDPEKSIIFSSAADDINSIHKHRNFSGFLENDEVQILDSPSQSTEASCNATNMHSKVKCSSSNNNNNANYENSYGSGVFLTDSNFDAQDDSKLNLSYNSYRNNEDISPTSPEEIKINIKAELSHAHPLPKFEDLQNRERQEVDMMTCLELSSPLNTDAPKVSSHTALPPISLLSGRKTSVKNDEESLSSISPSISSQSHNPIENMKVDDPQSESTASEDFSPVFPEADPNIASNFCRYGQRAHSQGFMETNDVLKNICKDR